MRILTNENQAFDLNNLPDEIEDLRYCVLDYSDTSNVDYYWYPLVVLDCFSSPVVDLVLGGKYRISMPLDWSIVIGDSFYGNIEIMPIKHLNDRGFTSFCFNPIGADKKGYVPHFYEVEFLNIFPDLKWYFPKLRSGHILAVPLEDGENPQCAFFVKEVSKLPEILDITKIF
jgi:hypothetical protein